MKIGYARVSTQDQNFELQEDALKKTGCELIFKEKASGAKADRPELGRLIKHLRKGDIVVVYKLDRLGRSLKHLLEIVDLFNQKEVGLQSISDSIDATTPQGRLFFNISASFAEFEKDLIRERTKAGLEAARARGRKGGRRSGMSKEAEKKAILAETYYKEGKMSVIEISKEIGVSKMTLYKYLRHRNVSIGSYIKHDK
ncbi:recombinase family protein [Elizabethkingia anophelis]|uniref:recombinase family protein n=1 Tax=Elizabethkingia anophelis TaxID=1117645 RepID=UPI001365650C|nr:recombinase family protein [Elizabethkingia anophelis]MCT3946674.1 recombinase family protein [Elizabethkingia anophelis]MCT3996288.1 recombinase family protein [Elizabethkingia anophelis]MCT3999943.1 recombinase family protein [Elizabethkingia anophelis]MCT4256506.1 recombinase family protein [Elizabethkingia anophelis]MDV3876166.1 resolvase [Elizabethkingia anophelis]